MSRSVHKLRSEAWYGTFARWFRLDNLELRRRGRVKRAKDRDRVDAEQLGDPQEAAWFDTYWDDDEPPDDPPPIGLAPHEATLPFATVGDAMRVTWRGRP